MFFKSICSQCKLFRQSHSQMFHVHTVPDRNCCQVFVVQANYVNCRTIAAKFMVAMETSRRHWLWIGHAWKLCRNRWHHVDISSRHQLITTSGFRPPSWIYNCRKCQTRLQAWVRRKNLRTKVVGISSLASTEPDILLGVIYPPPLLATYVMRETCNSRVNFYDNYTNV